MKHEFVHPDNQTELQRLVTFCDRDFEARTEEALKVLSSNKSLRLFGLTGPTCAGKTTAAKKITDMLEKSGIQVHVISIDDFYYDKEQLHRQAAEDPSVEIDYDSEKTIDTDLFAACTEALLAGKTVQLPCFDFQSGMRVKGKTIHPCKEDVFLFEGIQILYPSIHAVLSQSPAYRSLFICPTSSISVGGETFLPNEIRLCRRLVRDHLHRAASPEFTLYLWKSVRANEEKNIFPHAASCHATIDSTMPYEMGMLKPYLEPLLQSVPSTDENYPTACALLKKIRPIKPIPIEYRTENSLYKEFI